MPNKQLCLGENQSNMDGDATVKRCKQREAAAVAKAVDKKQ